MLLPYLTSAVAPIEAEFRKTPEDFEVEEIPAYEPSGTGTHVMAWIEKRDLTTREAVRRICARVGTDPEGAGWAGLKDRRAIARQWISLAGTTPEAVRGVEVEGARVLDAAAHPHKLRVGHLEANRFVVLLREVDASRMDDLRRVLSEIEASGLPNYYGEQRFGRDGDNAEHALAWVRGETRAPRSKFRRKLEMSALQARMFNHCVADRVQSSTLGKVCEGDVMKKHGSGGEFVADDVAAAQRRADAWEISPTGPMFGTKMRWPTGDAREREEAILAAAGLTPELLAKWKGIAPGTRRFVRVPLPGVGLDVSDHTARLEFTLPAGSYATILMRELLKRDAQIEKSG